MIQADYTIQWLIQDKISSFGGKIIKGEEHLQKDKKKECKQVYELFKAKQAANQFKIDCLKGVQFGNTTYELDKLCFWVDPIDSTAGYLNERQYEATILIGVSDATKNNTPIIGVVGHCFPSQTNKKFDPVIIAAVNDLKPICIKIYCNLDKYQVLGNKYTISKLLKPQETLGTAYMAVGNRYYSHQRGENILCHSDMIAKKLGVELLLLGGAGYKFLSIINGVANAVVHFGFEQNDMSWAKWDTCGCQAIILALGGYCVDPKALKPINYDPKQPKIKNGIFATLSKDMFERFKAVMMMDL